LFLVGQVDGEDFFDLEFRDITNMIPILKIQKKFVSLWSQVTGLVSKEQSSIIEL
jgi:hypothetical protein